MGRKRRIVRKQRVVLRLRHKRERSERLQKVATRSAIVALVGGLCFGILSQGDSVLSQFVRQHTPAVDIRMPQTLSGIPIEGALPTNRFWLWFPWAGSWVNRRLLHEYPAVKTATFERRMAENRVIVRVEARKPLARWGSSGFDADGILFPLAPEHWTELPKAEFSPNLDRRQLAHWMSALSLASALWPKIRGLSDDRYGTLLIDLDTGTRVVWGPLSTVKMKEKLAGLALALADAHQHLGGSAFADLRFFDEGRIIVRPKTVKG